MRTMCLDWNQKLGKGIMKAMKERFDSQLSKRDQSWLRHAVKLAKMSTAGVHHHGAVITMGGRIVAVGINTMRNDPTNNGRGIPADGFAEHAEMAALRALGGNAQGAKVYVARWRWRSGTVGMSRPCNNCYKSLMEAGVKEVIFTT